MIVRGMDAFVGPAFRLLIVFNRDAPHKDRHGIFGDNRRPSRSVIVVNFGHGRIMNDSDAPRKTGNTAMDDHLVTARRCTIVQLPANGLLGSRGARTENMKNAEAESSYS